MIQQRTDEDMLRAMQPDESTVGTKDEAEGTGGTEVTLGGRMYVIRPIRGRANSRWFRRQVGPIIENIEGIAPLAMLLADKKDGVNIQLEKEHVSALVGIFKQLGGPQFDVLLDTVYRYCPAIAKDREFLEGYVVSEDGLVLDVAGVALLKDEESGEFIGEPAMSGEGASDEEFLDAFLVVMKMVYGPFVQMLGLKMKTPNPASTMTDQNESSVPIG